MKKIILLITFCFIILISYSQSNWQEVYSEKQQYALQNITFSDSLTGYAVGQGGRIVKTTDGGYKWDTLVSNTKKTLFFVYFIDNNTGYACGDGGIIIKTNDGGKIWKIQNTLITDCLNVIRPIDKDTVFAFGVKGTLLKTVDGGKNWQSLKKITFENISSAQLLNSKTGYFISYGSNPTFLFKTNNFGKKWEKNKVNLETYKIFFIDTLTGYGIEFMNNANQGLK